MKLYSGKIPTIAEEIIAGLTAAPADDSAAIEVSDAKEAVLDVESVLKEYLRLDRESTDKAKDIMEQRSLPYSQFGKIKRSIAEEKGFALGEEGINWMTTQITETFMQSPHIEEVYAEDVVMRKIIKDVLRKHMAVDDELDEEVRRRIKNLQEGTSSWDVEYSKVMDQMKRKHGIDK